MMMERVILVQRSAIVAGRSQPVVLARHHQLATAYLDETPCWLGPAPSQLGNNIYQATWLVDPTRSRPGHHGCRPSQAWLLVITTRNGKVTGLDHRSVGVINAPPPKRPAGGTPTGTTSTGASTSPTGGAGGPTGTNGPTGTGVPTGSTPVATQTTVPPTSVTSSQTVSATSSAPSQSTTTQAFTSNTTSVPTVSSSPPPPSSSTFTIVTTTTPNG
jgi:hypothetical protein